MGNIAVAEELAGLDELEERYMLDASESGPEDDEGDEDSEDDDEDDSEDDEDEGIKPEEMPHG